MNQKKMTDEIKNPEYLYKVISLENWETSQRDKVVPKGVIDKDFIHLATKEQLGRITEKFWKNEDYVVLKVNVKKINGSLRFEKNPGGSTKFIIFMMATFPLMLLQK